MAIRVRCGLRRGHRDPHLRHARNGERRAAQVLLDAFALLAAEPGGVGDDRDDAVVALARADSRGVRQVVEGIGRLSHAASDIGAATALATVFRAAAYLYSEAMINILGWRGRIRGLFADTKGPWGTKSGSNGGPSADPPTGAGDRGKDPAHGVSPGSGDDARKERAATSPRSTNSCAAAAPASAATAVAAAARAAFPEALTAR